MYVCMCVIPQWQKTKSSVKIQITNQEKLFVIYITNRKLFSVKYKEPLTVRGKSTQTQQKK